MAPPDGARMTGEPDPMVISYRELLMEMREAQRRLEAAVSAQGAEIARLADMIAREQDLGNERRSAMRRTADALGAQVEDHGRRIDGLERRNDRMDGAALFAKAAFGTSVIALVAVLLQVINTFDPGLLKP